MEHTYSPREFGKLIGKSVNTLQKWDRKGLLKAYRSPTNRRYYTHEQYLRYRGFIACEQGKTIAYARVSSPSQKRDLVMQKEALRAYSPEQELVKDLLAIVTVFSTRLHGLRSHKTAIRAAALGKEVKDDQGTQDQIEPNA
jgi:predicted site-specific integrase-resolvase